MKSFKLGIFAILMFAMSSFQTASAGTFNVTIPFNYNNFMDPAGDLDSFYFTASSDGFYTFYSDNTSLDMVLNVYGDQALGGALTWISGNDDGCGFADNFFLSVYLFAGESVRLDVDEFFDDTGAYSVHGLYAGTSASSAADYCTSNSDVSDEASAVSLPLTLFTLLGLGAVRLRRFFA